MTEAQAPDEERVSLYRLYNSEEELLYVGISNDPNHRWHRHVGDKPWASEVAMRVFEWLPSRAEAEAAEVKAIRREKPKYNILHTAEPKAPRPPKPPMRPAPEDAVAFGYLSLGDIAFMLNMKPNSLSFIRTHSKPGGRYASDPFPTPDRTIARTPVWLAERADEIKAWSARRPGQGRGGGQPSHRKAPE